MDLLIALLVQFGTLLVFGVVLVEQLGVPIPAYPVLMVAGGLAAHGGGRSAALVVLAAVAGCLIADSVWYIAGTRYGRRILGMLCRISLTPDNCVRQTESVFHRFGAASLVVAKFIPGFATVATAMAGATRVKPCAFLLYDTLGATLWATVGTGLGVLFSDAIRDLLRRFSELGRFGLWIILGAVVLFVFRKWWQRHRFSRLLKMHRIAPLELADLVARGEMPLILDARTIQGWSAGHIAGARTTHHPDWAGALSTHAKDAPVIVYCACPNDASAVVAARKLMAQGYTDVRPLEGGVDAWVASGGRLEFEASDSGHLSHVLARPDPSLP